MGAKVTVKREKGNRKRETLRSSEGNLLGSADPIRMDDPISMGWGEGLSTCIFPRRDEVDEQSFV